MNNQKIQKLAQLPESAIRFKANFDDLIELYKWLRSQWTPAAVKELTQAYYLDLRKPQDRALFALMAAKELADEALELPVNQPVAQIDQTPKAAQNDQKESQVAKILCQAIAFLNPVPPTNGLENAPAWAILGKPVYVDELRENYKKLARKWHPDTNNHPEAAERFALINAIYKNLSESWFTKYSPLIPIEQIGQDNLARAMAKEFPFSAESFWV